MKNSIFTWILSLTFLAAVGNTNATELVTNGEFGNGTSGWNFSGSSKVILGKDVGTYNSIDLLLMINIYKNGNVALFGSDNSVNGNNGNITQILNTVIGQNYDLTFDYDAIGSAYPQHIDVFISNGSDVLEYDRFKTLAKEHLDLLMTKYTMNFTALSTQTTLRFFDPNIANPVHADGALDNVSVSAVSAVPEPDTYTMLLAGLGLMGFMLRRRKTL